MTERKTTASNEASDEFRPPLVHITYFRLVDRSPKTLNLFLALCRKYLSGHEGQVYFSVGPRATEMTRDVNVLSFDVAMNMIFDCIDSYQKYRQHPRHLEFITQSVGMSSTRSVYDSYVDHTPLQTAGKSAPPAKASS